MLERLVKRIGRRGPITLPAIVLCVGFCLSPTAAAGGLEPATAAALQDRLGDLIARQPKATRVGLVVAEADSGDRTFAHQPDVPLKPASVQKLFVTAAALDRWGPQFRFETRVYLAGSELWVVGAGDPGLGDDRLADRHRQDINRVFDEWAAALRAAGATSLSRIVLDDSIFDDEYCHPDWPDNQADRWYQAPVGGLNVNDNCLDATVVVRGNDIRLKLQPELSPGLVDEKLTRGKRQRPIIRRPAASDVFIVQGPVTNGGALDPVAARQPTIFFAYALQGALGRRGIEIRGDVVRRRLSEAELATAQLVATHSTALPDILWRCNTFSQNLFAECLLKALAAYEPDGRRNGTVGSWEAGQQVLRTTLDRMGVDQSGATLRDGSGLSHRNQATAAQLTNVLLHMRRHPQAAVFFASLAEAGELGSMQRRYADPLLRGRLHGKTGTLAGVHSLAGYLTRPDGTVLAFALLINGQSDAGLAVQICKILVTTE